MKKRRRNYTKEFKEEAVKLIIEQTNSPHRNLIVYG
ncbi:MAG: transposase [Desulfobacteraceae bacterium]|nr:transposase [Desulfobacteraceae bacterium]